MGLRAHIYKYEGQSFSNGGISEFADEVTIMNIEGNDEPSPRAPAVLLVPGNLRNTANVVPAIEENGEWYEFHTNAAGPMAGGTIVSTSDSRFHDAVQKLTGARTGAVDFHDRYESWELYNRMFN